MRIISLVLLAVVMPLAAVEEKPSKPKRPRALIITGSDVDPHDWRPTGNMWRNG